MQEKSGKDIFKKREDLLAEYPKTHTVIGPDFFKRTNEVVRPYLIAHKAAKNADIAFGNPKTRYGLLVCVLKDESNHCINKNP